MKKPIKAISIFFIIVLGSILLINFSTPLILKRYAMKGEDLAILHLKPTGELNNIVLPDYLATLMAYDLKNLKISLPKDFVFAREKNNIATFRKAEKEKNLSVILISYKPSGFFMKWKGSSGKEFKEIKNLGINSDYDFFTKVIYATTEDLKEPLDLTFLMLKRMISPRMENAKNLKIYKYFNNGQKGYITTHTGSTIAAFACDIFDKKSNYFHLMIRDSTLSLEKVCTIISTIVRE